MPKLRRLSGDEVIKIFERFDFYVYSKKGSHVKLRRLVSEDKYQSLTIPCHKELDLGTLRAIIRQTSQFISENILRSCFYSE